MNLRIQELLKQTGVTDNWNKADWYSMSPEMIEKFAELIVRECMEQVWYTREDGINGNVSEIIKDRIKKHFGVEP